MQRRSALKLLAASLLADRIYAQQPPRFEFFTKDQEQVVTRLTEMIIPADAHSSGASEARVPEFIDLYLAHAPAKDQQIWTQGISALDAENHRLHGKGFTDCSEQQQDLLLSTLAANEAKPSTPAEKFFSTAKRMTIRGYYTSPAGLHKELKYLGNVPLAEFPGCNHPEHQR